MAKNAWEVLALKLVPKRSCRTWIAPEGPQASGRLTRGGTKSISLLLEHLGTTITFNHETLSLLIQGDEILTQRRSWKKVVS